MLDPAGSSRAEGPPAIGRNGTLGILSSFIGRDADHSSAAPHERALECASMRPTIAKLRKTLPKFISVTKYCEIKGCCKSTAYNDMRRISGLGVKIGANTFINRDVALDEMARMEEPIPWVPQEERTKKPPQGCMRDPHGEAQP
jgi:hypothetical protein